MVVSTLTAKSNSPSNFSAIWYTCVYTWKVTMHVDVYLLHLDTSSTTHRSIPAHQPWGTVLLQAPLMDLERLTSLKVQAQCVTYVKLQCTCTYAGSLAALTVHVFNNSHSCLELLSECVFVSLLIRRLGLRTGRLFFHNACRQLRPDMEGLTHTYLSNTKLKALEFQNL